MTASRPASGVDYDDVWQRTYGDMQDAGPTHRHMRRLLRQILDRLEYRTVLDVGCGLGHNLPLLVGRNADRAITGVDVSSWAIQEVRRRAHGCFEQLDVERDRLDGKWDLVFSSLVLEHLKDDEAALRNMRAMAGRYLLVSTISGNFDRYESWERRMGHVRNYSVGELEEKLATAGFNEIRTLYWGFPFYSPIGRTLQTFGSTGTGQFSPVAAAIAEVLYYLYWLNSSRRGDVLIALARV